MQNNIIGKTNPSDKKSPKQVLTLYKQPAINKKNTTGLNMKTPLTNYSKLFHTEYDETGPIGANSAGMHYTILSFPQWRGINNEPLQPVKNQRVCLVWDETHDTSILALLEHALISGLLAPVKYFWMFKGEIVVILDNESKYLKSVPYYKEWQDLDPHGDMEYYGCCLATLDTASTFFLDDEQKLMTYFKNIDNLWSLGLQMYQPLDFFVGRRGPKEFCSCSENTSGWIEPEIPF